MLCTPSICNLWEKSINYNVTCLYTLKTFESEITQIRVPWGLNHLTRDLFPNDPEIGLNNAESTQTLKFLECPTIVKAGICHTKHSAAAPMDELPQCRYSHR